MLGFERRRPDRRAGGAGLRGPAGSPVMNRKDEPAVRQDLAGVRRDEETREDWPRTAAEAAAAPGPVPEGSVEKLLWTQSMARQRPPSALGSGAHGGHRRVGHVRLERHLLGAPGYRIAGGSDEIQRNIIGERVLGLPSEPCADRDVPFRHIKDIKNVAGVSVR